MFVHVRVLDFSFSIKGHDSAEPKKFSDAKISLFVFGREKNSNFRF